mmetsp:Transcript_58972/g.103681  ORF Transcript_58972/g.103681 Transcript_58972/m.103681 type:complete len:231 (+) Transcript_58972:248-940(+)
MCAHELARGGRLYGGIDIHIIHTFAHVGLAPLQRHRRPFAFVSFRLQFLVVGQAHETQGFRHDRGGEVWHIRTLGHLQYLCGQGTPGPLRDYLAIRMLFGLGIHTDFSVQNQRAGRADLASEVQEVFVGGFLSLGGRAGHRDHLGGTHQLLKVRHVLFEHALHLRHIGEQIDTYTMHFRVGEGVFEDGRVSGAETGQLRVALDGDQRFFQCIRVCLVLNLRAQNLLHDVF